MDGDPAVEPELDSFSRILPLPYRVAIILVAGKRDRRVYPQALELKFHVGVWAWGSNLQYLHFVRIVCDTCSFL
jgi:hypothetical protein